MNYSIGEMARIIGVAPSTLRYYDREGLLPFVERTDGGIRVFQDKDIAALRLIQCLKKTGLSIRGIREFIALPDDGEETIERRLAILTQQKEALSAQMKELSEMAEVVDYKLWYYRTAKSAGTTAVPRELPAASLPAAARAGLEKLHAR